MQNEGENGTDNCETNRNFEAKYSQPALKWMAEFSVYKFSRRVHELVDSSWKTCDEKLFQLENCNAKAAWEFGSQYSSHLVKHLTMKVWANSCNLKN